MNLHLNLAPFYGKIEEDCLICIVCRTREDQIPQGHHLKEPACTFPSELLDLLAALLLVPLVLLLHLAFTAVQGISELRGWDNREKKAIRTGKSNLCGATTIQGWSCLRTGARRMHSHICGHSSES